MCLVTFIQPAEFIFLSSLQLPEYLASTNASSGSLHLHQPLPSSFQQNQTQPTKIASESKRRCVSSLSLSPLNLSFSHPCNYPHKCFQARSTSLHQPLPNQTQASMIASESKRRCVSSLSLSPLNLSFPHPCNYLHI